MPSSTGQANQERMNKDDQGRPHGTAQSEDPDPTGLVLGGELDGACKGDQAWKSGDIGVLEILEVICLKFGNLERLSRIMRILHGKPFPSIIFHCGMQKDR